MNQTFFSEEWIATFHWSKLIKAEHFAEDLKIYLSIINKLVSEMTTNKRKKEQKEI